MSEISPQQALAALAGRPERLAVRGTLRLDPKRPLELPDELSAFGLDASGCTWLRALPKKLRLLGRLDVSLCPLSELPQGLTASSIVLRGCTAIETLPEGLSLSFLDATDCRALSRWPERGSFSHGHLLLRNCVSLRELPPWLESVARLDLAGCVGIRELPARLRISSFVDVADTGITTLPPALAGTPLRWRGAPVDERIAFRPETIDAGEVLAEPNVELRRVKLARVGYERFFREANALAIDEDRDRGGVRRLFRVDLEGDEPVVCLAVICPSTGRRYVLRVPPTLTRCHDAAAWIAGFDDPAAYAPDVET